MSCNQYSGPKYHELFSTNNQLLLKKWKLNSAVKKTSTRSTRMSNSITSVIFTSFKIYDDQSKTYVYCLNGKSPVPLMHWPKAKNNVILPYTVLVFQLHFTTGASVLINIGVANNKNQHKRIIISSKQKNEYITSLSVTLPLALPNLEMWSHLIVDIEDVFSSTWKKEMFKNIDALSIGGILRLKRVFALRKDLVCCQKGSYFVKYEELPRQISLSQQLSQTSLYIPHLNPDTEDKEKNADLTSSADSKFCQSVSSSKATLSEYSYSKNNETHSSKHTFTKSTGSIKKSTSNISHKTYDINSEKESAFESSLFQSENEIIPMLSTLSFTDSMLFCDDE